ncbi:MAG TPA: ABC transporter substrate-binding protein, partial [Gaiellaceae bacterium]|nr:ABC transporter substrate-binding protein [Gaiellaceae bacterium]
AKAGGSGILRVGTLNYIDSFNPINFIEAQAYNAFIMIYPQLVQYTYGKKGYSFQGDWAKSWKVSKDGKTWTFTVRSGTKWSDGQPLTAEDAAWTINTIVKYANGATAVAAPALNHVKNATAPNPTTLVIHYESPVGNVLAQLEQFFVLPKHVYEKYAATPGGKGLKTFHPEQHMPIVSAGAYTIKSYEKKGTTVFIPDPNFWGPPSHADAVALTYYTNADSMIADLKQGNLDWVDQVPFDAIKAVSKMAGVKLSKTLGGETTNITWNSNPRKLKNRELLDPRVKKAISMCVNRKQIINVVFQGHASLVESLVGHISPMENPHLGPLKYDCKAGNAMLDKLGYTKGPDGIRVAPATTGKYAQAAHPMSYDIVTPTSTDFNINREFQIVQQGFKAAGVKVTQKVGGDSTATYEIETDSKCDASKSVGYSKFDIAMWDWVGYVDPDFQLSVVTKGQWCSWSDTGWDNPAYDKLYVKQGTTIDYEKRLAIVWKMQKMIWDNFVYTQLVNEELYDAHSSKWTGFNIELNAYSKQYYTGPRKA